jgi:asparagine synthase (glutamine-hydrolysing)
MANFLLIVDPDKGRRAAMAAAAAKDVRIFPHLSAGAFDNDVLSVLWAVSPTAPVSQHSDRGNYCQLFGEPLDERGRPCDAAAVAERYAGDFTQPSQLSGFYASVFHGPRRGVRVEADVLGLFPIYYWHQGSVLLAGSSMELFRLHPLFSSQVNTQAIAALLLTSGLVGGETLGKGVHRLRPDHILTFTAGCYVREMEPPPIPRYIPPSGIDETVEEVESIHDRFLRGSLARSRAPGILLSGGLDSRLLAGLVARLGHNPRSLTFGSPDDMDAQCATRVAETLGLRQTVDNIQPEAYPGYAENSVRWEQLSAGLYAIPMGWNLASKPPEHGIDRIVSGLTLDAVIGGPKQVSASRANLTFEKLRVSSLGFTPDELSRLIREPGLRRSCDDVRQTVLDEYMRSDREDYLRTWRINLSCRNRFPVGACAWRYSLHAWPILPALDRSLLKLAANLPHYVVADRWVQKSLLLRHFPRLAALELDRNYFDTRPLDSSTGSMIFSWRRRLFKARCHAKALLGADPRFYVRVMGFNSPGWRKVRNISEGCRSSLREFFNLDVLDKILPGPGVRIQRKTDAILHSTPLKNTLGLMHWFHQRA